MRYKNIPHFETEDQAWQWMEREVNDECVDNHRLAYLDDSASMEQYQKDKSGGCCGSFDHEVQIGNRSAMIGCNYGH